jgi:uncharacterized Rmd1/YagE family protein
MDGMNVSELIRARQDYLELSEGISVMKLKLIFQWVSACVKQVNVGSSANIRWGF